MSHLTEEEIKRLRIDAIREAFRRGETIDPKDIEFLLWRTNR